MESRTTAKPVVDRGRGDGSMAHYGADLVEPDDDVPGREQPIHRGMLVRVGDNAAPIGQFRPEIAR
jgi:hypothetical protein